MIQGLILFYAENNSFCELRNTTELKDIFC